MDLVFRDPSPDIGRARALARARAMSWDTSAESSDDLARLAVGSLYLAQHYLDWTSSTPAEDAAFTSLTSDADTSGAVRLFDPPANLPTDRARAVAALLLPWRAMVTTRDLVRVEQTTTYRSADAVVSETSGWPLVVAGVALVTVAAVAVGVIVGDGMAVLDRYIARSEDTKRLVAKQAAAQELLRAHAEREDRAGKQLDMSAEEKAFYDSLIKDAHAIATKRDADFKTQSLFGSVKDAAKSAGAGFGAGVALAAVGLAALYIFVLKGSLK